MKPLAATGREDWCLINSGAGESKPQLPPCDTARFWVNTGPLWESGRGAGGGMGRASFHIEIMVGRWEATPRLHVSPSCQLETGENLGWGSAGLGAKTTVSLVTPRLCSPVALFLPPPMAFAMPRSHIMCCHRLHRCLRLLPSPLSWSTCLSALPVVLLRT